ncbi:hypothetical protein ACWF76_33820 [Streptomyces globisporus]
MGEAVARLGRLLLVHDVDRGGRGGRLLLAAVCGRGGILTPDAGVSILTGF